MHRLTAAEWAQFIQQHSDVHLLQTPTWGVLKSNFGWKPQYIQQGDLGAMVLFRRLPLGLSVAYIPRGPVGAGDWAAFWPGVDDLCRAENAVFLRVEPEVWEPATPGFTSINLPGFVATQQTIQPPRTVMVSLVESEEDLLAAMKSKTRYNIRLAERKDVVVKPSDDVAAFHHMMLTTGERDAFGIHSLAYYQKVYDLFAAEGKCTLLTATYEEKPLAGLMVFVQGQTAWYLYGASTNKERNRMPAYLLQWEAMRWAKSRGCTQYDLWGVPDLPEDALEERFMDRSDGLWGVYRFKRGFGGEIRRTIGAWDKVYRPALYRLYQIYTRSRREASA
jgi:lipid II:glycine glycyltransferase (peptidoglycan interpeptide bridge formation enzyme)